MSDARSDLQYMSDLSALRAAQASELARKAVLGLRIGAAVIGLAAIVGGYLYADSFGENFHGAGRRSRGRRQ